jgi:GNAT superfamily N-acetyltransferase
MTIEAGPGELFTTTARAADVPALVALINGAYRGDGSQRGWTSEGHLIAGPRTSVEAVRGLIEAPDSAILVVRAQSGLFACAHLSKKDGDSCYLGLLTVRPTLQGSGIGRQMLAAAESYARSAFGARILEMTVVNAREELIAWYERRGYTRSGETRPFPYDDSLGVPQRDDLRFVVLRRQIAP